MFCSKCGSALAADAAFCTGCGTPVVRSAPLAAPPGAAGQARPMVAANVGVAGFSAAPGQLYAGFWLRFVAIIVDGLVTSTAGFLLFIPLLLMMGGAAKLGILRDLEHNQPPDPAVVFATISTVLTFVCALVVAKWLYYAYFESSDWQATPGKRVMSIYVTDTEGQRLTFLHATGRFFAKIVTGLVPFGIGYMLAGFTERKQALHDMIAGTLVVRR